MKKGNGRHIGSSSQLVFLVCSLLLLLLAACKGESTPQATPWGTVIGDTVQTKEHYSLHDIISNGELILLTLSGPETYYEYRGGGLGTQYLLCEKFAQQIGVPRYFGDDFPLVERRGRHHDSDRLGISER